MFINLMEGLLLSSNLFINLNNISFFEKLENFADKIDETVELFIEEVYNLFSEDFVSPIENKFVKTRTNLEKIKQFIKVHKEKQISKLNYDLVIKELKEEIENNKNKFTLTPTQKLISRTLSKKRCVIIYLGLFYNFETNVWDKLELLKEIVHTSIKIKVPIILLGENNPTNFIPKLNQALSAFFSNSNYITPYHYKSRWFDNPIRLPKNKINKNPCKVSMNQMVDDILDQYQIEKDVYKILKITDIKF